MDHPFGTTFDTAGSCGFLAEVHCSLAEPLDLEPALEAYVACSTTATSATLRARVGSGDSLPFPRRKLVILVLARTPTVAADDHAWRLEATAPNMQKGSGKLVN